MDAVPATLRDGQVVPFAPIPWPDGASIELRLTEEETGEIVGMTEEEQSGSPEAIARWQAMVAALPTGDWTDADQEEGERIRREDENREQANQERREQRFDFPQ